MMTSGQNAAYFSFNMSTTDELATRFVRAAVLRTDAIVPQDIHSPYIGLLWGRRPA